MLQVIPCIGTVDTAKNGQEALDFVRQNETDDKQVCHYSLIFLDLNMPIMNGYEACRQIAEFYFNKFGEKF